MSTQTYLDGLIEEKLLNIHTAYIGKVLSYNNGTATVQPLNMIKQYGKSAQAPSVVSNAPVIQSARYKLEKKSVEGTTVLSPTEISTGDLVVCVCGDRNITEAKLGNMATPPLGHHDISDSIVVGVL